MRTLWFLVPAAVVLSVGLGGGLTGCSEDALDPTRDASPADPEPACRPDGGGSGSGARSEPLLVRLVGAGGGEFGTAEVSNDGERLYVTLTPATGWVLGHSRLGVATALEEFPRPWRAHFGALIFQRFHGFVREFTYSVRLREGWYASQQQLVMASSVMLYKLGPRGRPQAVRFAWAEGTPYQHPGWMATFEYGVQQTGAGECRMTVEFPGGGEVFCAGQYAEILWTSEGDVCGTEVRIELLRAGEVCQVLAESAPNNGFFTWEAVEACGGEIEGYTIRVTDPTSGASDTSDEPFMISDCPEG